jgi:tetratricopeptide (TPR) repeat protein
MPKPVGETPVVEEPTRAAQPKSQTRQASSKRAWWIGGGALLLLAGAVFFAQLKNQDASLNPPVDGHASIEGQDIVAPPSHNSGAQDLQDASSSNATLVLQDASSLGGDAGADAQASEQLDAAAQKQISRSRSMSKEAALKILREAKGHVAKLQWEDARLKYQRVVDGKKLTRRGYLGLAQVAFQQKHHDDAIVFAKKAGSSKEARTLLGHAYFRVNNYKDALRGVKATRAKLGGQ